MLPATALADTPLPPVIDEDMTWTEAGSPYTGGYVTIASGATVTAEPGAVVKVLQLVVQGTINAQGSVFNPVVFTSQQDSAPGQWKAIYVEAPGSSFDHVEIRNGGQNYVGQLTLGNVNLSVTNSTIKNSLGPGIEVMNSDPTITGSTFLNNQNGIRVRSGNPQISQNTIEQSTSDGIYYWGTALTIGSVTVQGNTVRQNGGDGFRLFEQGVSPGQGFAGGVLSGNTFEQNPGDAIEFWGNDGITYVPIPQDVNQNTATGNGCNCVNLYIASVSDDMTWQPGLTFVVGDTLQVKPPAILTIDGGVVVKGKVPNSRLVNEGDLRIQGSPGNQVVFTSFKDDTHGGDTNNDGSQTQPLPGDWSGITNWGDASIQRGKFLFGGYTRQIPFDLGMVSFPQLGGGGPVDVRNSEFAYAANYAIHVGAEEDRHPNIEYNDFRGNVGYALYNQSGVELTAPNNDWNCDSGPQPLGCGEWINYPEVDPPPFGGDPGELCLGGDPDCALESEPVMLATGNFTHTHTDLRLTGKSIPLEFTRSYNSRDTSDAGLGRGWSHTGLISALTLEGGDVVIRRKSGRRDRYTFTDPGYDPPSGVHDTLEKNSDQTYTLTTLDRTVYQFDQTGRIATITDDHGQVTTYGYDQNGRLESITDPAGQSLTFTYDETNHITGVSDSAGRSVTYTYDQDQNLETVTDPLGGTATYAYDSSHRMTSITDPNGEAFIENTYDSEERVVEQRDGEQNLWALSYSEGQTEVTEPEGGTKTYTFDDEFRQTASTDQEGGITTYSYDSDGNVSEIGRPGGATTTFTYDAKGNLTHITDPESGERDFTYDDLNRLTDLTDARQNTWSFTWSAENDLTEITDPKDGTTTFTYDEAGLPLTVTDPENHTTTYAYDSRANLTSVTNPLDSEWIYAYDQYNNLTSAAEPGKDPKTYTRNALGDLLAFTDAEGASTGFQYDGNGELTQIEDPEDNTWQIERNSMERVTAIVDPLSRRTEIAYDGNLNPISVTDRRGNATTYAYDLANRLTELTKPEGGTYALSYDGRGNVTQLTDPRGKSTSYTYDLLDRLTRLDEPLSTTTSYTYDPESNLTSVTDPRGNETSFTHDELNLLIEIAQPLGKTTSFTYDGAQNLKTRTTAAGTLTYTYDDADQLTEVKEGEETLKAFGYDAPGRIIQATGKDGTTISIAYDQADRPTLIDDGLGQITALTYDPRGNLTSQQDARGTTGYAFNELQRLSALTDPEGQTASFAYDEEGNLDSEVLPNGVTTQTTHDQDGRVTEILSSKEGQTLDRFRYSYDQSGNRTSQTERTGQKTSYSYDDLNRLTKMWRPLKLVTPYIHPYPYGEDPGVRRAAPPDPSHVQKLPYKVTTYAYDQAGNRTKAGSTTYTYDDLNQLTSSSDGWTYAYDQAGRLTEKTKGSETVTYGWDLFDQLSSVTNSSETTTFNYDALGRRTSRTSGGETEVAHYGDLSDVPTFDTDGGGGVVRSYVEGPLGLVEERSQGETTYPLADAHGDVTALTDQSGSVTSRHSYDPWGAPRSTNTRQMGYLGAYLRRRDPDSGLIQMGARQYDPSLGQFLSEDPALGIQGLGQSLNRHAYAFDNPLIFMDLDGRMAACACLTFHGLDDIAKAVIEEAKLDATAGLNVMRNFFPTNWDEQYEDWRQGVSKLPRSIQILDKLLLEWGPWLLPGPKIGALGKVGRYIKVVGGRKPDIKLIDNIVKKLKLTRGQREILHREITRQHYDPGEIEDIARQIKRLHPNK